MFDKVKQGKQLLELRSQAKQMQKQLEGITETVETGDVRVKVTADQKVVYIKNGDEDMPEVAKAINEAFKKVQKKAAQEMMKSGDLGSLLGGLK